MASEEANSVKPEKFNGQNFRIWQSQMIYWLTVLGFYSALEEQTPTPSETAPSETAKESTSSTATLSKDQIDFHCRHRILSTLSDRLYDVYRSTTSNAKELWSLLEAEYGIEDATLLQ